jgi:hypothetical protein
MNNVDLIFLQHLVDFLRYKLLIYVMPYWLYLDNHKQHILDEFRHHFVSESSRNVGYLVEWDYRFGEQEFCRGDFGNRLLAAESEEGGGSEGEGCVWIEAISFW